MRIIETFLPGQQPKHRATPGAPKISIDTFMMTALLRDSTNCARCFRRHRRCTLFKTSSETMLTIATDPKHLDAASGSAMTHQPHVHMIVPGVSCRPRFFLSVRVLSRLFRRLFLEKLVAAHRAGELQFFNGHASLVDAQAFATCLAPLRNSEWVVYSKRPFGGPKEVLLYLGGYTHRVTISNRR
jgi:hypothetical protein